MTPCQECQKKVEFLIAEEAMNQQDAKHTTQLFSNLPLFEKQIQSKQASKQIKFHISFWFLNLVSISFFFFFFFLRGDRH